MKWLLLFLAVLPACGPARDVITLDGVWSVSFEDHPEFKDGARTAGTWHELKVPGPWHSVRPAAGIAWLVTEFSVPGNVPRNDRALSFRAFDVDEAYLNGVLIGRTGSIADPMSHAYGHLRNYHIPPGLLAERNHLAVRVRGLNPENSGITGGSVSIDAVKNVERERTLEEFQLLALAAIYLAAGGYFLLFFLRIPSLRAHLYFAVFCLLLSLYIGARAPLFADWLGFGNVKRFEYCVVLILPIAFFVFWSELFGVRYWRLQLAYYASIAAFLAVPLLSDSPADWSAAMSYYYIVLAPGLVAALGVLIVFAADRTKRAGILLVGTLVFFATVVNDILFDRQILNSRRIMQYGFLVFVGSLAATLVQSFVALQLQSQRTLERLREMDQLKERLLANVAELLLPAAAAILATAERLRAGASGLFADTEYQALTRQGNEMNEDLDGVMLLSRIQSGVESTSFRIIGAPELRRILKHKWPEDTRIFGTEATLRAIFSLLDPAAEIRWNAERGLTMGLAGEQHPGGLRETVLRESVKALGGQIMRGNDGGRVLFLPIPPEEAVDRMDNPVHLKTTALPRIVMSAVFIAVFAFLGAGALALLQTGHIAIAAVLLLHTWFPGRRKSTREAILSGRPGSYLRTALDQTQICICIGATGGIDSLLLPGLAIPPVLSSLGKDPWRGRFAAVYGALCVAAGEALSSAGIIPDTNILGKGPTRSEFWLIALAAVLLAAGLTLLAETVNRVYRQITEAREEAAQRLGTAGKLADFAKALNAEPDSGRVIEEIITYLQTDFNIDSMILLLPDEEGVLGVKRVFTAAGVRDELVKEATSLRIENGPEGGIVRMTFNRKKPLFIRVEGPRNVFRRPYPGIEHDRAFVEKLNLKWFHLVPLVVRNQAIGLVLLTSYKRPAGLTQRQAADVEAFINQVAGAVYASQMLDRAMHERDQAQILRKQTEATRQQAAALQERANRLAALFSELSRLGNMDAILERVMVYLKDEFEVDSWCSLYLVNQSNSTARCWAVRFPEWSSEEERRLILDTPIPLNDREGFMSRLYDLGGRSLYFREVRAGGLPIERKIIELYKFEDFLMIPIVESGSILGILNLSSGKRRGFSSGTRRELENLANQLSGIVRTHALMIEIENERKLAEALRTNAEEARRESESILARILPAPVARELKETGKVEPLFYDSVSVLFTDFVGFTGASEKMLPDELVAELDGCFSQFDEVVKRYRIEKLKTIGDSYMCAAGLPAISSTHAIDICLAALEFRSFMAQAQEIKTSLGLDFWQLRIGIHTGPVTAGVIGTNKLAYDIWGDTVNTASRLESASEPGRINISGEAYSLVKDFFECEYRGKIKAKGKGEIDMYFLNRIKPELSADEAGLLPNGKFEMARMELELS